MVAQDAPADVTVAAVMSTRLITVEANAALAEARDLLRRHDIHHLLVTDRHQVVAVLSDRDLLRSVSPFVGTISEQVRDAHTLLRPVFQLASYHPRTVRPEASVTEAAAIMLEHEISCLPVADRWGRTVGVVTTRDLLRGLLACALPASGRQPPRAA